MCINWYIRFSLFCVWVGGHSGKGPNNGMLAGATPLHGTWKVGLPTHFLGLKINNQRKESNG